ncbi:MAG: hypothetical protein COU81_03475 [Candidatus Portnoybacteria bacterium CG10_big_fil_rev_8_21_14_0_10_36_7]|uniref:Radical SAM core domain-containing protein n=1 Tax=Candidatus Portnoybacteria bacterium CG10_big_fil_rev_8_21_14_0_10_36_7 TaxID=1974812 RepID=A0A2M8KDE8_9BACT|nr:MAG: hypothetical protein COU81_03475 [Candidatus Portnoybacteria bacterium CG10_big_fil_rev_8_21_14_0_10_36_7]
MTPDWVFKNCKVNFIVRSEPELTCTELVKTILSGKNDFGNIEGLSYRYHDKTFHNSDRTFVNDLTDYPFPDYGSLPMHLYRYSTGDLEWPFTIMLSSRGCPGQCVFCLKKMMPSRYRAVSAKKVYEEIKYLVSEFGIKSIYFQDWEFVIDRARVKELCLILIESTDINITWGCSARASSLDREILTLMKRAGCKLINFGFESGSNKVVGLSQKGVTLSRVTEVANLCRELDINLRAFCLANLPGENRKTLKESAKFIVNNDLNVPRINTPIPYPGTKLAKMVGSNSWGGALDLAGKVNTVLRPERARKILRNYIWRERYGQLFFVNPKFLRYAFSILRNKFF